MGVKRVGVVTFSEACVAGTTPPEDRELIQATVPAIANTMRQITTRTMRVACLDLGSLSDLKGPVRPSIGRSSMSDTGKLPLLTGRLSCSISNNVFADHSSVAVTWAAFFLEEP